MHQFTDAADRPWDVTITIGAIKRVMGLVGVNLAKLTEPREKGSDQPLLTELESDIVLFCDILYALVKPQADKDNISDEEFGRSLAGEAFGRAAEAFWEELTDFFRPLPRGAVVVSAIGKQKELLERAAGMALRRLDEFQLPEEAEDQPISGNSSTSLPESSA